MPKTAAEEKQALVVRILSALKLTDDFENDLNTVASTIKSMGDTVALNAELSKPHADDAPEDGSILYYFVNLLLSEDRCLSHVVTILDLLYIKSTESNPQSFITPALKPILNDNVKFKTLLHLLANKIHQLSEQNTEFNNKTIERLLWVIGFILNYVTPIQLFEALACERITFDSSFDLLFKARERLIKGRIDEVSSAGLDHAITKLEDGFSSIQNTIAAVPEWPRSTMALIPSIWHTIQCIDDYEVGGFIAYLTVKNKSRNMLYMLMNTLDEQEDSSAQSISNILLTLVRRAKNPYDITALTRALCFFKVPGLENFTLIHLWLRFCFCNMASRKLPGVQKNLARALVLLVEKGSNKDRALIAEAISCKIRISSDAYSSGLYCWLRITFEPHEQATTDLAAPLLLVIQAANSQQTQQLGNMMAQRFNFYESPFSLLFKSFESSLQKNPELAETIMKIFAELALKHPSLSEIQRMMTIHFQYVVSQSTQKHILQHDFLVALVKLGITQANAPLLRMVEALFGGNSKLNEQLIKEVLSENSILEKIEAVLSDKNTEPKVRFGLMQIVVQFTNVYHSIARPVSLFSNTATFPRRFQHADIIKNIYYAFFKGLQHGAQMPKELEREFLATNRPKYYLEQYCTKKLQSLDGQRFWEQVLSRSNHPVAHLVDAHRTPGKVGETRTRQRLREVHEKAQTERQDEISRQNQDGAFEMTNMGRL